MSENRQPIKIRQSVNQETAAEALKILNWYFDERPDRYLVQKPRVMYDSDGNERRTVRYEIRQRTQSEKPDQAAGQTESNQEGESNHEQGTIQQ